MFLKVNKGKQMNILYTTEVTASFIALNVPVKLGSVIPLYSIALKYNDPALLNRFKSMVNREFQVQGVLGSVEKFCQANEDGTTGIWLKSTTQPTVVDGNNDPINLEKERIWSPAQVCVAFALKVGVGKNGPFQSLELLGVQVLNNGNPKTPSTPESTPKVQFDKVRR